MTSFSGYGNPPIYFSHAFSWPFGNWVPQPGSLGGRKRSNMLPNYLVPSPGSSSSKSQRWMSRDGTEYING